VVRAAIQNAASVAALLITTAFPASKPVGRIEGRPPRLVFHPYQSAVARLFLLDA